MQERLSKNQYNTQSGTYSEKTGGRNVITKDNKTNHPHRRYEVQS